MHHELDSCVMLCTRDVSALTMQAFVAASVFSDIDVFGCVCSTAIFLALQPKSTKVKGCPFAVVWAMRTLADYYLRMLHLTGQRLSYMAEFYLLRISALEHVARMPLSSPLYMSGHQVAC